MNARAMLAGSLTTAVGVVVGFVLGRQAPRPPAAGRPRTAITVAPAAPPLVLPVAAAPPDELTPREVEVLVQLATGKTDKAIARELGIAYETVRTHVSTILAKLRLQSRTQAALYAAQADLARVMVQPATPPEDLDLRVRRLQPHERAVLELLAAGHAAATIAHRLGISPKSVEARRTRIYGILGITNQVDAAAYARAAGLVPPAREAHRNGGDEA